MKILKWLLFGGLVLVGLFVAIGFILPDAYEVRRSIKIDAPPEGVFPLVHDLKHLVEWSPWLELDPEMEIEVSETSVGVGATYRWKSDTQGSGTMEIIQVEPPNRVVHEMRFEGFEETPSNAEFVVLPVDGGSEVTWRFYGDFGGNPISRYFGLFLQGMVGETYEQGLVNLKSLVEETTNGGEAQ